MVGFCFLPSSLVFRRTKLPKQMVLFLILHVYKNWVWGIGRWEWKKWNAQSAVWGEEHAEEHRDISMCICPWIIWHCIGFTWQSLGVEWPKPLFPISLHWWRGEGIRSEVKPGKKRGKVIYDLVFISHYPTLIWLAINSINFPQSSLVCLWQYLWQYHVRGLSLPLPPARSLWLFSVQPGRGGVEQLWRPHPAKINLPHCSNISTEKKPFNFFRNSPTFIVSFQGSILYTESILSFAVILAALKVVSFSVAHLEFMMWNTMTQLRGCHQCHPHNLSQTFVPLANFW